MIVPHSSQPRIFISKHQEELSLLPTFCADNHFLLEMHSFLSFSKLPFQVDMRQFDAVFFSSSRSASFFLQTIDCSQKLIAVAGESTQQFVIKKGLNVHFSPKKSGNISESVLEFTRWVTTQNIQKIIFPCSDISKKSYAEKLPPERYQSICVYQTHITPLEIPLSDVYIFTSSSNVQGFFSINTLPHSAHVLAWGETTRNALLDDIPEEKLFTLQEGTERAVIDWLESRKNSKVEKKSEAAKRGKVSD